MKLVKNTSPVMCFQNTPKGLIVRACYLCLRPNSGLCMRTANWVVPMCPICFESNGFRKKVPFQDQTAPAKPTDFDIDLLPAND